MLGYSGKLLRINLTTGKISADGLDPGMARKFLGGRGLGARFLFDEVPPGTDPLAPENKLIFVTGPLAGTYAPGSGRFAIIGKSPLTGVFGEAYSGGSFAHELKYAGYDGIILEGKSSKKAYIHIRNDKVEIRSAARIWGMETLEMEELLKEELGDRDYRIASIGPAGENGVRFACIMNDTDRAAGRTGLAAVMGSKNLKAIALRGTGQVRIADPAKFRDSVLSDMKKIKAHPWLGDDLPLHGTSGGVETFSRMGILPTRNWESGTYEHADRIGGRAIRNTVLIGHRACQSCPIGCTRVTRVESGPYAGVRPEYGGLEYETVAAFGSLCQHSNLEAMSLANQRCNAYGMDTISTGSVIAFAMDCFEKGLLTGKQIGFDLPWGDSEAILKMVDLIAKRQGIGELLAEGTRGAAEKIGGAAPELAVHVKGLELGMHEPRGKKGLGLSYAAAPRGADHMEGFHDPPFTNPDAMPELGIVKPMDRFTLEGKPRAVSVVEDYTSFINSIPICSFMSMTIAGIHNSEEVTGMLAAATGWKDLSLEEELAIGERSYNLARAFTVQESGGKADDRLPHKMTMPLPDGETRGQAITEEDLKKALGEYYAVRGWSAQGCPTKAKLEELGLEKAARRLHGSGGKR